MAEILLTVNCFYGVWYIDAQALIWPARLWGRSEIVTSGGWCGCVWGILGVVWARSVSVIFSTYIIFCALLHFSCLVKWMGAFMDNRRESERDLMSCALGRLKVINSHGWARQSHRRFSAAKGASLISLNMAHPFFSCYHSFKLRYSTIYIYNYISTMRYLWNINNHQVLIQCLMRVEHLPPS